MGVTDPHLLDDCVLDLAVTNDFVFGSDYAHAQQVLAARLALQKPSPSTSAAQKTIYATGEILDHTSEPEFHFDATKGDVIWVHDPDCVDRLPNMHPVGFALLAPSGANLGFGIGCEFNRRELPETGAYTLRAGFKYRDETVRWRVPIRFVRPDRHAPMAYGQSITGTIDMKAAHDVYAFTAQAGDVLKISGAGCDVDGLILTIVDAQAHEIGGSGLPTRRQLQGAAKRQLSTRGQLTRRRPGALPIRVPGRSVQVTPECKPDGTQTGSSVKHFGESIATHWGSMPKSA